MKKNYLFQMNKSIKNKWVKALESGKFKQAKGRLKYGNAYCCLGVLVEVTPNAGITTYRDNKIDNKYSCMAENSVPSKYFIKHVGLTQHRDVYKNKIKDIKINRVSKKTLDSLQEELKYKELDACLLLYTMNDDYGFKFKQIANFIRNYIKGV